MKYEQVKFSTMDSWAELIKPIIYTNASFEVIDVNNMSKAVSIIENIIRERGLRYRTYTSKRAIISSVAAVGGTASAPVGILAGFSVAPYVAIGGIAAVVGIGAHRLATWNPDYEIIKYRIGKKILVEYKK